MDDFKQLSSSDEKFNPSLSDEKDLFIQKDILKLNTYKI